MSDVRQIPLFPDLPTSAEDLNRHTELRHTVSIFQQYLIREGKSEHTIKAFTSDLQLLGEQSGETTAVGQYTTTMLNAFLDWLEYGRGVPCSRKSYARRVTTLKVYFKWLHTLGAILHDPAKAVLQRSGPAPLATVLAPDEVQAAIFAARQMKRGEEPDTRPEMLFRLILDTGIKKSETVALVPQHIDRSDPKKPLLVVRHKVRNVYKERKIELSPEWVRLLDEYLMQYRPQETIFNCTARNLEYILTDIGEAAGIPHKLSFEMLRWTCAVRDTRAGQTEDYIREKLGLSPISWVETHEKLKKLVEQQLQDESAGV
ncbi:MAG: site-specific integrase [Chloroflexi bacterium]|nr:site-specific integrase [Chloroflexota bacterium]